MANCCSGQTCYKLVTIGDIESMINAASLDCTNYSSANSITYDGCCGNEDYSGYSPNLNELSANTGNIRFQNWSGNTHLYKDNDGIVVTNPNWDNSTCCSGITNVPLNDINFRYDRFSGFTVSGVITSSTCSSGKNGVAQFSYGMERHEVNGCTDVDTTISSETVTNTGSYNIWSDIISAVSVSEGTSEGTWQDYNRYRDTKIGYITIPKDNIFEPIFDESIIITNNGGNCDGITVRSSGTSVNVRIMPKFRGCAKTSSIGTYTAKKLSGVTGSFVWYNDTCGDNIIPRGGVSGMTIGKYNGITPSYYSVGEGGSIRFNGENVILDVERNTNAQERNITVTISFEICNKIQTTYCTFCQERGVPIPPPIGGCCATGLATLFPSINCGDEMPS